MNRPLCLLAVSAIGLIAGCTSRNNMFERPYIGTWYAQGQETSYTWKLEEDGDFGEGKGYVTPDAKGGSWHVDKGNELVVTTKVDGKTVEQRGRAKVVGNTMTVEKADGTIIFTKIGE